jgi:diguanylate cyclase (GGDEF)-like protein
MPGMDGMMLIDQLKELQPDPVCLLVTGCKQLEWYKEVGDDGPGVDVIQKPWNGDQLAGALRQAISEYRTRAQSMPPSERPEELDDREVVMVGFAVDAELTVEALLGDAYCALRAGDLDEAEHLLRTRAGICCCLLMDKGDTSIAIRRLRRQAPAVPVIALGSEFAETAAVEAIRKGAQDWLPIEGLERAELSRAIAVANERSRAPLGPLPVCTELSNPTLLLDRFRQATSRARRFSHQAGILLVDVDRFSDINSSLGYQAGNELLEKVAERLRSSVRESDAVLRLREDEFALVLEDLGDGDTVDVPAQRVLNSFATPFRCGGHEIVLTASIGGAVFPVHGQGADELLDRASQALQRAKEEGNRYRTLSEQPDAVDPLIAADVKDVTAVASALN